MIKWIRHRIVRGWLYLAASLVVSSLLIYGAIWFLIEPLSIPELINFLGYEKMPRSIFHVSVSVVLSPYICLFILAGTIYNKDGTAKPLVDNRFSMKEARSFYNIIAPYYDSRNTKNLLKTHEKVISIIKNNLRRVKGGFILDLGGGTGKLITHHFFDNTSISWHYVDNSSEMLKLFNENMYGTKLNVSSELSDIDSFVVDKCKSGKFKEKYDIILICLTLTSMEKNPDWASLASLIKIGGRLIIADIDASYTSKYPYYIFDINQKSFGFIPRKIPMTSLLQEIAGLHLDYIDAHAIFDDSQNYSFVVEFEKT